MVPKRRSPQPSLRRGIADDPLDPVGEPRVGHADEEVLGVRPPPVGGEERIAEDACFAMSAAPDSSRNARRPRASKVACPGWRSSRRGRAARPGSRAGHAPRCGRRAWPPRTGSRSSFSSNTRIARGNRQAHPRDEDAVELLDEHAAVAAGDERGEAERAHLGRGRDDAAHLADHRVEQREVAELGRGPVERARRAGSPRRSCCSPTRRAPPAGPARTSAASIAAIDASPPGRVEGDARDGGRHLVGLRDGLDEHGPVAGDAGLPMRMPESRAVETPSCRATFTVTAPPLARTASTRPPSTSAIA